MATYRIKDDIYDDFSKIYRNLDAQALFIQSLSTDGLWGLLMIERVK